MIGVPAGTVWPLLHDLPQPSAYTSLSPCETTQSAASTTGLASSSKTNWPPLIVTSGGTSVEEYGTGTGSGTPAGISRFSVSARSFGAGVPASNMPSDRKSVGEGKGVSVRVDPGGSRCIKTKKNTKKI